MYQKPHHTRHNAYHKHDDAKQHNHYVKPLEQHMQHHHHASAKPKQKSNTLEKPASKKSKSMSYNQALM